MPWTKRILLGTDVTQANRRIRWAYICGYLYAGVFVFNAITLFSVGDLEVKGLWSTGQAVFVVLEASLVAFLSFGLSQRNKLAAIGLFVYFLLSRVPLLILGFLPAANELEWSAAYLDGLMKLVVMQILPAYLFFQGLRGVLTFHDLKDRDYPDEAFDS